MIIYDHCSSSGVVDFYRALLNHPDDKVVGWIVEYVARFSRVRAIDAFEEAASENIERINDYAIKNFQYYLKDSWWQAMDDFNIGKFNDFHFSIVSLIEKYPGPIWSDFCLLLLKERSNFSSLHYGLYNKLLRSIAKTKSHDLVFPIIDLIGYEKYVSDGGNVFVKKCLKAAGALGKKADAELLNNRFDIESEGREDVVKEYYKAIARLGRKKH